MAAVHLGWVNVSQNRSLETALHFTGASAAVAAIFLYSRAKIWSRATPSTSQKPVHRPVLIQPCCWLQLHRHQNTEVAWGIKQHCIPQLGVGNFKAVSVQLPVEMRQDGWVPCLDLLLACCGTQGIFSASVSCYRMSTIILIYLVLL